MMLSWHGAVKREQIELDDSNHLRSEAHHEAFWLCHRRHKRGCLSISSILPYSQSSVNNFMSFQNCVFFLCVVGGFDKFTYVVIPLAWKRRIIFLITVCYPGCSAVVSFGGRLRAQNLC